MINHFTPATILIQVLPTDQALLLKLQHLKSSKQDLATETLLNQIPTNTNL